MYNMYITIISFHIFETFNHKDFNILSNISEKDGSIESLKYKCLCLTDFCVLQRFNYVTLEKKTCLAKLCEIYIMKNALEYGKPSMLPDTSYEIVKCWK